MASSGNRQVVSLWHLVKTHLLTSDPGTPPPIVECPFMCGSELAITGIPPSEPGIEQAVGVVLLCGHMACRQCYEGWQDHSVLQERDATCIICRHKMMHKATFCSHPIRATVIPSSCEDGQTLAQTLAKVPRTVPEGRDGRPLSCNACLSQELIDMTAKVLQAVIAVEAGGVIFYLFRALLVYAMAIALVYNNHQ
ncbi:hypothetical protein QBC44DRAFT_310970 [Cladorrhinum sp. PSN332]|nr:hypothetical protein QBC44DRAFT_310970 [Cladorrhinum sp. PSN332]